MCIGGLLLASLVTGTLGTASSIVASNRQASYEARIARQSARISEEQAVVAERKGQMELEQHMRGARLLKGQQIASYAGSGVQVGEGTPMALARQTEEKAEQDALTIRYNSALQAWGYRAQAAGQYAEAALASSKRRSLLLPTLESILEGGTKFAMYKKYIK